MSDAPREPVPTPSRRRFLAGGARYALLGGLLGYFAHQKLRAARLEGDPNCVRLYTCADCIEFSGCSLPKAEDFRGAGTADRA